MNDNYQPRLVNILAMLGLLSMLSACGLKGPLYQTPAPSEQIEQAEKSKNNTTSKSENTPENNTDSKAP